MRFKDLDKKVRGFRSIDLYICHDGSIGVCVANCYFGRHDTVKGALDMAFTEAQRRKERG